MEQLIQQLVQAMLAAQQTLPPDQMNFNATKLSRPYRPPEAAPSPGVVNPSANPMAMSGFYAEDEGRVYQPR